MGGILFHNICIPQKERFHGTIPGNGTGHREIVLWECTLKMERFSQGDPMEKGHQAGQARHHIYGEILTRRSYGEGAPGRASPAPHLLAAFPNRVRKECREIPCLLLTTTYARISSSIE